MAKKPKKNFKKQVQQQSKEKELAIEKVMPNFQNTEYLKLREEMLEALRQEKLEYEQEVQQIKESEEYAEKVKALEEANVQKFLTEKEREEQEEASAISEQELEDTIPEIMKEIDLFNNYLDKRMATRVREMSITNNNKDDFRVSKYLQVNKLPQKPRTAKLDTEEQVVTMLSSSKKEIYERSGKKKAIQKARLTKEQKNYFDKLFAERVKLEAEIVMMFQPKGSRIPMYELYWSIQNTIVSYQKIYKDLKTPFLEIPKFEFCDSLVWSARYFLEMIYTDSYDLEFLKKDIMEYAEELYETHLEENGTVSAFDLEEATISVLQEMIARHKYSKMVVHVK